METVNGTVDFAGDGVIVRNCPFCTGSHRHRLLPYERNGQSIVRESNCSPGGPYKIILQR